jgi:hypothetical protein
MPTRKEYTPEFKDQAVRFVRVRHRDTASETTNARWARKQISRAIEFLAFLHNHRLTLTTCTQADVDLRLAGPPSRRGARDFVRWAHRRGLCSELVIANRVQGWPTRQLAPGVHVQTVRPAAQRRHDRTRRPRQRPPRRLLRTAPSTTRPPHGRRHHHRRHYGHHPLRTRPG